MYITKKEAILLKIFRCPDCGLMYRNDSKNTVGHDLVTQTTSGNCCHYTDKEITAIQWSKINDILFV